MNKNIQQQQKKVSVHVITVIAPSILFFLSFSFANAQNFPSSPPPGSEIIGQTNSGQIVYQPDAQGPHLADPSTPSTPTDNKEKDDPRCTQPPDLDLRDLQFRRASTNEVVNQNQLIVGETYVPLMIIRNMSCAPTDAVFADGRVSQFQGSVLNTYYFNSQYGSNGRFQVLANLNIPSYNNLRVNQLGPIPPAIGGYDQRYIISGTYTIGSQFRAGSDINNIYYAFPVVTFTASDVGTRNFAVTLDAQCDNPNAWGCIYEIDGGNYRDSYSEPYTVINPDIDLGTFLMPNPNTVSDPRLANTREITTGQQVGLYWQQHLVDINTCTGYSISNNSGGNPNDFNGRADISGLTNSLESQLPAPRAQVDININEPAPGVSYTYVITCQALNSTVMVSDSVTISDGTVIDTSAPVILFPGVNNLNHPPGTFGIDVPFNINNLGASDVSGYRTTVFINDVRYGIPTLQGTAPRGNSTPHTQYAAWDGPSTPQVVLYRVCVSHPDMTTPSCSSAAINIATVPPLPQCADGIDNDGDGLVDYPADPGCTDSVDDDERDITAPLAQCADMLDNDGDGLVDSSDPGCTSAADDDERDAPAGISQCADGLDNDVDGLTDYPSDPGCTSAADDDERNTTIVPLTQCSDSVDNDGDGLIGADDPGCWTNPNDRNTYDPSDDDERNACSDGIDNDGDGLVDSADRGCRPNPGDPAASYDPNDNDEFNLLYPICNALSFSPSTLDRGTNTTLSWATTDATSISYATSRGASGTLTPMDGFRSFSLMDVGTHTFTLTLRSSDNLTNSCSTSVTVNAAPTITATPAVIRQGGVVDVTWDPNGGTNCTLLPTNLFGGQNATVSGSTSVSPSGDVTVTITCDGGVRADADIRVIPEIFET